MQVDILATEPHFRDHLRPVHEALLAAGVDSRWNESEKTLDQDRKATGLCASYGDLKKLRQSGRQVILAEHGAGQSYGGSDKAFHTSYSGGGDRHGVIAYLTPGPHSTERNKRVHPWTACYEVGCPKLDAWADFKPKKAAKPLVVISFHWDCFVTHETRSAFYEYREAVIAAAKSAEFSLAVHSHPRIANEVRAWAKATGLEWIERFDEVLERASVYAVDNSSTLFEFAATGRPVLVINSAHYRRGIDHGLRFWRESGIGVNCNQPGDLRPAILEALADSVKQRQARTASVRRVYGAPLGQATSLAVDAIKEIISEEHVIVSQHIVRAKSSAMGYAGIVSKDWVIALYPSHVAITDGKGREFTREYSPAGTCNPESRAREMVGTGVYEAVAVPKAPSRGTVSTPPHASENKIAPPAQEHKAVDADSESSDIDRAVLDCVRKGYAKTATKKEVALADGVTQDDVVEAWDRLYAAGTIVDGEERFTYKVAE